MSEQYFVRSLNEQDVDIIQDNDAHPSMSESIKSSLDVIDYAWGLFYNDEIIGYCTLGYADYRSYVEGAISTYPGYNNSNLLLSDVFILPEYRGEKLSILMIQEVFKKHPDTENNLVFLELLHPELYKLYELAGFTNVCKYTMVNDTKKQKEVK